MEKPFVKSLTAVAVGAGAIAICLFGYHINNQQQHQQRINYAESAITNQKDTLTSLSKEVDKLYSTKEKIFLNPEITEETISQVCPISYPLSNFQQMITTSKNQNCLKKLLQSKMRRKQS